tara:strand:- start:65 stop:661 length:597 start_codon:yes stop_codon:yes gene_type:complete
MDSELKNMGREVSEIFKDSSKLISKIVNNEELNKTICLMVNSIAIAIKNKKKVLFFGNGGSAADAQHMAGEFISRFMFHRESMPGIALTTDSSVITSIGNDYGFDQLFSRQIEGLGNLGDIAIGFSTSGKSPNVIYALKKSKEKGLITFGLTGINGDEMKKYTDLLIKVPSDSVPRIQEGHLLIGHVICQLVEDKLFG